MLWMVSHVHEFVNRVGDGIESVALYCIVLYCISVEGEDEDNEEEGQ